MSWLGWGICSVEQRRVSFRGRLGEGDVTTLSSGTIVDMPRCPSLGKKLVSMFRLQAFYSVKQKKKINKYTNDDKQPSVELIDRDSVSALRSAKCYFDRNSPVLICR